MNKRFLVIPATFALALAGCSSGETDTTPPTTSGTNDVSYPDECR